MASEIVDKLSKKMAERIGHGMREKCYVHAEVAEQFFNAKTESVAKSPAAMMGSSAKAAALKMQINGVLMDAICGDKEKYRTHDGFIRWGVVEGDINEIIDAALR